MIVCGILSFFIIEKTLFFCGIKHDHDIDTNKEK